MDPLRNYRALLARVDELCQTIQTSWSEHLSCKKGCDGCCRHLEVSAVEAAAVAEAVSRLPEGVRAVLADGPAEAAGGDCPLLLGGECLLYEARPLICRTHGYPVLVQEGERRRADFCPRNFRGVQSLPGSAFIDLDRINEALTAINLLFLRETGGADAPPRVPLADALRRIK